MTTEPWLPSPSNELPGAVAALPPDDGVPAHYGDPVREQRRLVAGRGTVDLSHLGVIRVTGADRLGWLHDLTSADLRRLRPGAGAQALLLDPQGRVRHHLRLVDDGTATWLVVEPGVAPALAAELDRLRFVRRVEVADVTANHAVVWTPDASDAALVGGGARSMGDDAVVAGPVAAASGVTPPVPVVTLPLLRGAFRLVDRTELLAALTTWGGGAGPAGLWAYEALRVAAHEPREGLETDDRSIPNELGWVPAVASTTKGCYPGNETVTRVWSIGRPPRRLVLLHLDGSEHVLPEAGSPVLLAAAAEAGAASPDAGDAGAAGEVVGHVGTAARHHEDGPIALAVVRTALPVDAVLRVRCADGTLLAASQEVVVPPDTGLGVGAQVRAFRAAQRATPLTPARGPAAPGASGQTLPDAAPPPGARRLM